MAPLVCFVSDDEGEKRKEELSLGQTTVADSEVEGKVEE